MTATTVEEFIVDVHTKVSREFRKELAECRNVIEYHHSFGRWIRNNYGLWNDGSKLVEATGKEHPDDASHELIKSYQAWLLERQKTFGDAYDPS